MLARPVLLGVYKLFAQIAENDAAVHSAMRSVIEFFSRPTGGAYVRIYHRMVSNAEIIAHADGAF